MVAADGHAVAVAHDHDDVEPGVGRLGAGRQSQGAAVRRVHGRPVQVGGDAPGAADAGDHAGAVGIELERQNGVDQRPGDDAVGAPRTPQRLGRAQVLRDLARAMRRDARQAGVVRGVFEKLFVDQGAHAVSSKW